MELFKVSQVQLSKRVENLNNFLKLFHSNLDIKQKLTDWGYSYGEEPLQVPERILPMEKIILGDVAKRDTNVWPNADNNIVSFDRIIMDQKCSIIPRLPVLKYIFGRSDVLNQERALGLIRKGLETVGLKVDMDEIIIIDGSTIDFTTATKKLPPDTTMASVFLPYQNKEKYDAIEKMAALEMGLSTQEITTKLLIDGRKANGASVVIGMQIFAKLGYKPRWINIPIKAAMICGYDTYHDTAQRGRSFINSKYLIDGPLNLLLIAFF